MRSYSHGRLYLEILGGKHDGLLLDSHSNDLIEREFLVHLLASPHFVEVFRVESNGDSWVQLRQKT